MEAGPQLCGGAPAAGAGAGLPSSGGLAEMLTPLLDRDRDGSVVNDIAGMVGRYLGGR